MRIILVFIFTAGMSLVAHAQSAPQAVPPTMAQALQLLALDSITNALCDAGQKCAPTTAQEKANPPLSTADAELVIRRAYLSAYASRCGLDWQKLNYLPMMRYLRTTAKLNERQMAIVGTMHGIVQGIGEQVQGCDDGMRASLAKTLPFNP